MKALAFGIWIAALVPAWAFGAAQERAGVDPRVAAQFATLPNNVTLPVWVVFADKGVHEAWKASPPGDLVSERSLQRRRKVRLEKALLDAGDLPLDESYVSAVERTGAKVRQRSKWLNRISVEATAAEIATIALLPGVRAIEPLARFRRRRAEETPGVVAPEKPTPARKPSGSIDYGPSFKQLQQIGVTTLHAQGITGQNVLVGHFDNGYRLLAHESLLPVTIVAAHDFVDGDADPAPPVSAPSSFGAHGILTLSALAGWAPGNLIGAAFGAHFVLARTEDDASETPLEEDNWVAAIEWADSIGIDVASTSLGYLDFDVPFPSFTWENMDGNTTVITRAADLAVGRGIVVVNSAGNQGLNTLHNTLIGPADGDSVIAVGAVDTLGVRASFSSVGPTTDGLGRIKPDIDACGVRVRCASTTGTTDYRTASGTSLSCPLAAGVAALLVSARPAATPMQIRDAMRLTASQAGSPDNLLGWGILNAPAALAYLSATDVAGDEANWTRSLSVAPNPMRGETTIRYALSSPATVAVTIVDATGRRVRTLRRGAEAAGSRALVWNGRDDADRVLPNGVYFVQLELPAAHGAQHVRAKTVLLR